MLWRVNSSGANLLEAASWITSGRIRGFCVHLPPRAFQGPPAGAVRLRSLTSCRRGRAISESQACPLSVMSYTLRVLPAGPSRGRRAFRNPLPRGALSVSSYHSPRVSALASYREVGGDTSGLRHWSTVLLRSAQLGGYGSTLNSSGGSTRRFSALPGSLFRLRHPSSRPSALFTGTRDLAAPALLSYHPQWPAFYRRRSQ